MSKAFWEFASEDRRILQDSITSTRLRPIDLCIIIDIGEKKSERSCNAAAKTFKDRDSLRKNV